MINDYRGVPIRVKRKTDNISKDERNRNQQQQQQQQKAKKTKQLRSHPHDGISSSNDTDTPVFAKGPNVSFELYRQAKTGKVRMGVFVKHMPVGKGDELLVSYGKGFWASRQQQAL